MVSFALIALFATAAIVALTSLADSALRFRNAWAVAKRDAVRAGAMTADISEGAVVMLRPAPGFGQPALTGPLAAAA